MLAGQDRRDLVVGLVNNMKVAFFDTHQFERNIFEEKNKNQEIKFKFIETRLNSQTASLASGCEAICAFVNDKLDESCLNELKILGSK